MNISPSINLHSVWRKFSQVVVKDAAQSVRYLVIYDLVPTNVRLYYSCDGNRELFRLWTNGHTDASPLRSMEPALNFGYIPAPF